MLLYVGLHKQGALFRGQTGAEPIKHDLFTVIFNGCRIVIVAGQGMPIGNKKITVVIILHSNPVFQGTQQIAEVQRSGGAHAA